MTESAMGCFGSIMLHDEADSYCQQCPVMADCKAAVDQNRVKIEASIGRPLFEGNIVTRVKAMTRAKQDAARDAAKVESLPIQDPKSKPAHRPVQAVPAPAPLTAPANKLTPYQASLRTDLKVKVKEQLEVWVSKGIDPALIDSRTNPFAGRHGFKIANQIVEALLLHSGKPTKAQLQADIAAAQAQTGEKQWSAASLQSNINIVTGAFAACGYVLLEGA